MEVLEDLEAATLIPRYSPSNETLAAVCSDSVVTPACLRTLYGTIDYTAKAPGKNRIGLTNYQGNSNNRSDIEQFLKKFRPDAAGAAYKFLEISIAGGSVSQAPDNGTGAQDLGHIEGDLDAEWVIGMSYPTPLTAYSTGGVSPFKPDGTESVDTNEPFLAWVQYTLAQPSIPQVISQSYSATEQTFPKAYATTVCRLFAQLAARGVTMLFSSGDFGVGQSGACFANDGTHARAFLPSFPSSCPYVTSVGATMGFNPEVVALDPLFGSTISGIPFAPGGGFSNYFARPIYQNKHVPQYIASLGGEFDGLYNKSGRGYPDISAQGFRYAVVWHGILLPGVSGTSSSTATAAGILSLVNDALIAAGKPVLGFLNPWLYKVGRFAFTDVLNGSAVGCNTSGFPAKTGWDAVTGFGTPVSSWRVILPIFSPFPHSLPVSVYIPSFADRMCSISHLSRH
jgi:tripeptidyl-peptidase I